MVVPLNDAPLWLFVSGVTASALKGTFVSPAPLPLKVPASVTALWLLVITAAGKRPGGTVP